MNPSAKKWIIKSEIINAFTIKFENYSDSNQNDYQKYFLNYFHNDNIFF